MKKLNEILLVDNDHVSNFISKTLLLKLGITDNVTIKTNGKEGLEYIKENCTPNSKTCPQFIIFDHYMPIMDGLEFLKELNKLKLSDSFQVVLLLLAVQIRPDILEKFLELGIQNYTFKPIDEISVMETYYKYWNKEGVWIG